MLYVKLHETRFTNQPYLAPGVNSMATLEEIPHYGARSRDVALPQ